jgi:hypothetical protein
VARTEPSPRRQFDVYKADGDLGIPVLLMLVVNSCGIRIGKQYERGVVFRLGRLSTSRGAASAVPSVLGHYLLTSRVGDGRASTL